MDGEIDYGKYDESEPVGTGDHRTQHNLRRFVECIPTTLNIGNCHLVRVAIHWHF